MMREDDSTAEVGDFIAIPGSGDQVYPFSPHPEFRYLADVDRPGSVVAYDPRNDTASLYLAETIFDSTSLANDINAFSMMPLPGPGAIALMVAGGLLGSTRSRHRGRR